MLNDAVGLGDNFIWEEVALSKPYNYTGPLLTK